MGRGRRTKAEKLMDKQSQLQGMLETNVALNYINNRLKRKNERLRCKLKYLEKMEKEIVEYS